MCLARICNTYSCDHAAGNLNRCTLGQASALPVECRACDLFRINISSILPGVTVRDNWRETRMATEIERKFLVDMAVVGPLDDGMEIQQGYVSTAGGATVRVRLAGDRAWLTLKGPATGISRSEFEYPIPPVDARQMIAEFCGERVITKIRYCRRYARHLWEIDVFGGDNAGLVVAEVELASESEQPELPPWAGREVTGDQRYFNSSLYHHPFRDWERD